MFVCVCVLPKVHLYPVLSVNINTVFRWDPDILVGYEIQMLSWGYIIQRASQLGVNLYTKISRIPGR